MRIEVGDTVRRKDGGPEMRVVEWGIRLLWCEWHDGECKMGQWFARDQLALVRSAR